MKPLLALLATTLLATTLAACGDSSKNIAARDASNAVSISGPSVLSRGGATHKKDRDGDEDNNNDDEHVLKFGHPAGAAENQVITALLGRYYAAAATEDGARACSLLTSVTAESVAEQDGHTAGLRGKSCVVVLSKLFRRDHLTLLSKSAHLKFIRAGIEGDRSLVVLEFPEILEIRQITLRRESKWTVLDLFDSRIE